MNYMLIIFITLLSIILNTKRDNCRLGIHHHSRHDTVSSWWTQMSILSFHVLERFMYTWHRVI